jgi:hypothetical protein
MAIKTVNGDDANLNVRDFCALIRPFRTGSYSLNRIRGVWILWTVYLFDAIDRLNTSIAHHVVQPTRQVDQYLVLCLFVGCRIYGVEGGRHSENSNLYTGG